MNESRAIPDAGPDFEHLMPQDVANVVATGAARTIATLPRPGLSAGLDLQREVEQFLYRQAELLDGKHWQAWIDLFDDQGVYWMPVTPQQTEWEGSPSIFAE